MWDLIVSVSDHCLSFYFSKIDTESFTAPSLNLTALAQVKVKLKFGLKDILRRKMQKRKTT